MITVYLKESKHLIKALEEVKNIECFVSMNDVYSYLILKGLRYTLFRDKIVQQPTIPVDVKEQLWKIEDEVNEITKDLKIEILNDTQAEHELELRPDHCFCVPKGE